MAQSTLFPVVLEVEKLKIFDCFLWPSAGSSTPQEFATAIGPDYGVSEDDVAQIAKQIEMQISRWQGVWEKTLKRWAQHGRKPFLHLFVLEVDLDGLVLRDRFHWDVNNLANSPEEFAEELVCDLGLKRTHEVLVAHAVRLQLFLAWEMLLTAEAEVIEKGQTVEGTIRSDPHCEWAPQLTVKTKTGETPGSADRYENRMRKSLKENLDDDLEGDEEEEDDEDDNDDDAEDEEEEEDEDDDIGAGGEEDEAKMESGSSMEE